MAASSGRLNSGFAAQTAMHLLPLLIAAGAARDDTGRRTYNERLMGKTVSAFQFG